MLVKFNDENSPDGYMCVDENMQGDVVFEIDDGKYGTLYRLDYQEVQQLVGALVSWLNGETDG
jgi:hypothetical protein